MAGQERSGGEEVVATEYSGILYMLGGRDEVVAQPVRYEDPKVPIMADPVAAVWSALGLAKEARGGRTISPEGVVALALIAESDRRRRPSDPESDKVWVVLGGIVVVRSLVPLATLALTPGHIVNRPDSDGIGTISTTPGGPTHRQAVWLPGNSPGPAVTEGPAILSQAGNGTSTYVIPNGSLDTVQKITFDQLRQ